MRVQTNALYYGDNLDILRRYVPDASVDLIYLDPPFNSNRDYNVIFKDESRVPGCALPAGSNFPKGLVFPRPTWRDGSWSIWSRLEGCPVVRRVQ